MSGGKNTEVLLNAARHADFDHMRGVSASVMCGQYGNYGTGMFNVVLDLEQMEQLQEAVITQKSNVENMFDNLNEIHDPGCATEDIVIHNNITNLKPNQEIVCNDNYNMGF